MAEHKTITTILLAIILAVIALFVIDRRYQFTIVAIPKFEHPVKIIPKSTSTVSTLNPIPSTLLLPVPFTPQAPTANWDTIHNEDCEEATAIMAAAYFSVFPSPIHGEGPGERLIKLPADFVEKELTKLTDWEMQTFGYNLDVTSEETAQMIKANYNLQTKILYSYTEEDIKKELTQNHLVLLPANGQLLKNPNYKQPGPKYHMLVIRGYNSAQIITNDPGTRNGLNYAYDFDTLYKANGNWSHETNSVDLTKKNAIVVWK